MVATIKDVKLPFKRIDYTDFAHIGRGTLAGTYLRRFWHPVYHANRIQASKARPIRILGEDLTLYRGESGEPHVVDFRCAHRGMQLSPGWVEGDCIRCFYHGWKYDGTGQCVEQPAEPKPFAEKVKIAGYPTEEYLGLIWTYMGEEPAPPLPRYPDFEDFEGVLDIHSGPRKCNFFNNVENSLDMSHIGFVHYGVDGSTDGFHDCPTIKSEETQWGIRNFTRWQSGSVNVSQFGMPYMLHVKALPKEPDVLGYTEFLTLKVPVDDENHIQYLVMKYPLPPEKQEQYWVRRKASLARWTVPHWEVADKILNGALDWDGFDHSTTEMIRVQDDVAQAGQGTIADRKHERLGRSDTGVILIRKLWTRELRALAEGQPLKQWFYDPEALHTEIDRDGEERW